MTTNFPAQTSVCQQLEITQTSPHVFRHPRSPASATGHWIAKCQITATLLVSSPVERDCGKKQLWMRTVMGKEEVFLLAQLSGPEPYWREETLN